MALEPHVAFGDLLRQSRRNAGLTQEELAERAGISTRAISNLERGVNRAPHRETLEMLAEAFDLSAEDRMQWERARSRLAGRSLKSAVGSVAGVSHLPATFTSFIGREPAVDEVSSLLRCADIRLLTLTGPGGIGKTRLSIEVVERLIRDGTRDAYFVPLAAIVHPDQIPLAIAQALDVRGAQGQTVLASICRYLRGQTLLLLLDNFEHVASGAPLVSTLLEECPAVSVLVTSRVPLRLRGEREYPLRSMSKAASSALFVDRMQAVNPGYRPDNGETDIIAAICGRLDGLPLAIELAAARSKVLSPSALLRRLDHPLDILIGGPRDMPGRQQTLRATIRWSYDLLRPHEQDLFQKLAVFVGGWTLEAAEAVGDSDVLNALAALIEISLVDVYDQSGGEPRFRMLETIREFGIELLVENGGEPVARDHHARYFAEVLAAAPLFLIGPDQILWLDLIEADHANIQAALDWYLEEDVETGLRMLGTLWSFWWLRTPLTTGRNYFARFLERADDTIDPAVLAAALTGAGIITQFESDLDLERARALHEQALSIWLDLSNPPEGTYWSFLNLGAIVQRDDNFEGAQAYFDQTIELSRRNNQPIGITAGLLLSGNLASTRGQTRLAMDLYQEGLEVAREIQDPFLTAAHLSSVGRLLVFAGRHDEARPLLEQALALNRAIGLSRHVAFVLQNLADILLMQEHLPEAAQILEESLEEARKVDDMGGQGWSHFGLGRVALKLGDLDGAMDSFRHGLDLCSVDVEHVCEVCSVEALAITINRKGNTDLAARLHAWSATFRERMGIPRRPLLQPELDSELQAIKDAFTPDEFEEVWRSGARMTLDEICAAVSA